MADPWEEALDLDDSDLPSLRPSKRHHPAAVSSQPPLRRCSLPQPSQNPQNLPSIPTVSPRLIPGPAGTVQSAMLRRRKTPNDAISGDDFEQELIPTREYIRRAVEEGIGDDGDFSGDPWLSAVEFIRCKGLTDGDGAIGVPLGAIKSGFNMDKVAQVVAIVKSCTPNGLGGLMVTLKDPTGTVDATIHGRVLTEGEFGKDISIGAAIILRKVTVFSPARSAHYLNITLNNMVKVFPKDARVPIQPHCSLPITKHSVPVNVAGHIEKSPISQRPSSLPQGTTQEIMSSLIQKENMKRSLNDNAQAKRCKTTINQLSTPQDAGNGGGGIAYGTNKERNSKDIVCEQLNNNLNPSHQAVDGGSAVHLNSGISDKESGAAIGTKPIKSGDSVLEWTDEQLDELFSLD